MMESTSFLLLYIFIDFLWLFIPFVQKDFKKNVAYGFCCIVFAVLRQYWFNLMNPVFHLVFYSNPAIPSGLADGLYSLSNLCILLLRNTIYFKITLHKNWLDSFLLTLVFSIFYASSNILEDMLQYIIVQNNLPFFPSLAAVLTICALGMSLWMKHQINLIDNFEKDKKSLVWMFLLLWILSERHAFFFNNTGDIPSGLLFAITPILLSVILHSFILKNHYYIERGRLQSYAHVSRNELDLLRHYETKMSETKHSWLHKLVSIQNMINQNHYQSANTYITDEISQINSTDNTIFSNNPYVDSLIRSYLAAHPERQLHFDITLPDTCPIDPADIGLILLCLLDTPLSQASPSAKAKYAIHQIENQVTIYSSIENFLILDSLSETDLSMLEDVLSHYKGSLHTNIKTDGDLMIILYFDHLIQ